MRVFVLCICTTVPQHYALMTSHEGRGENYTVHCFTTQHLFTARYDRCVYWSTGKQLCTVEQHLIEEQGVEQATKTRGVRPHNLDGPVGKLIGSLSPPASPSGVADLARYILPVPNRSRRSLHLVHYVSDFRMTLSAGSFETFLFHV